MENVLNSNNNNVYSRGGLVYEQYRRVGYEFQSDGQSLFLASRQTFGDGVAVNGQAQRVQQVFDHARLGQNRRGCRQLEIGGHGHRFPDRQQVAHEIVLLYITADVRHLRLVPYRSVQVHRARTTARPVEIIIILTIRVPRRGRLLHPQMDENISTR